MYVSIIHTLFACSLFTIDIAVVFSVCIYIYLYIHIPYVFVYIYYYYYFYIYIYIYFKCFLINRVRARATLLTIKNLHRTYALWLSFGLVGRQPFFITLLHAFLTVFSISLSRSFLSFLRGREIHGARVATNSN